MRDILFRGKRKDNGRWAYGYVDATMYKHIVVINTDDGGSQFEVQPDTVGEFTGLDDANDKPIYEGDIVAYKDKPFGIVIWHTNGYFCINDSFDMKERDYTPIGKLFELCYIREHENKFSVIGNIHDNPELLTN